MPKQKNAEVAEKYACYQVANAYSLVHIKAENLQNVTKWIFGKKL